MKALYTVLFQLVQWIQKELTLHVQLRMESVLLLGFRSFNKMPVKAREMNFPSAMKALYPVLFRLVQRIQKELTRTAAKGIGITSRVSQF